MQGRLTARTLVIATGHDLSLALLDGRKLLAESRQGIERGHAEALMPAIAHLLAPFGGGQAAPARIVVEVGPGSFTGLRVGLAAAQALALAWGSELKGVRSTQLVAAQARESGLEGSLFVALVAPRGQIWAEMFEAGDLSQVPAVIGLSVDDARAAAQGRADALVLGSGAALLGGAGPLLLPRAAALAGLADSGLVRAEPLYVRAAETQSIG
jgi:tRNA threonylcarbamoyl adenosine modification protein YeaZ